MNEKIKSTVIEAKNKWYFINLKQIFEFRELLYNLLLRDIKLRYHQTFIGFIWIILQPLTTVGVFTILFGKLAKLPNEGVPYTLFIFAGILPWFLFSQGVNRCSASIISNTNIIAKVFFPRLIIPFSSILSVLFDFIIIFLIFIGLLLITHSNISISILFLPIPLLITFLLTVGIGTFFAAASVYYRDFIHLIPFVLQILTFISPIGYSSSIIPLKFQFLYGLNPLVGIIEGFRWAFFGCSGFPWVTLSLSLFTSIMTFFIGIFFFKKMEGFFVDVV